MLRLNVNVLECDILSFFLMSTGSYIFQLKVLLWPDCFFFFFCPSLPKNPVLICSLSFSFSSFVKNYICFQPALRIKNLYVLSLQSKLMLAKETLTSGQVIADTKLINLRELHKIALLNSHILECLQSPTLLATVPLFMHSSFSIMTVILALKQSTPWKSSDRN